MDSSFLDGLLTTLDGSANLFQKRAQCLSNILFIYYLGMFNASQLMIA